MEIQIEKFRPVELASDDFARYVPDLTFRNGGLKETAKHYLDACVPAIRKLTHETDNADLILGTRTLMIDRLITTLYTAVEREVRQRTSHTGGQATLIAQGGYGRREMSLHSDIDLLFLYPKKKGPYIESLTEKILYVLWDVGLEVGYATRTVEECKKLFLEDITIMTSLLDRRFLCGSEIYAEALSDSIAGILGSATVRKKLLRKKIDERRTRIKKFGGTVFVLEPSVKDAAGSLRDLQFIPWVGKIMGVGGTFAELVSAGILEEGEYAHLMSARNFLLKIRNELHLAAGKKNDLLTFDRQELVATALGFAGSDGILGVERFMQTYYRIASQMEAIVDSVASRIAEQPRGLWRVIGRFRTKPINETFRIVDGKIAVRAPSLLDESPVRILEAFRLIQEKGLPLHEETRAALKFRSTEISDSFRENPEAISLFRKMMNDYRNLGKTLLAMHEVGFLDEWLPEFKKLRCRVQHDIYHIYTIDTHSLFAVQELGRLAAGEYHDRFPLYEQALKEVSSPEILTLGLLLHDIGKGEGGNHSVRGATIAAKITRREGFSDEEQKGVEFLILSHLLMPHLSQRRDLEAPELIIQFARSVGTIDYLNMLFLLTWADIRAVGPEAWTNWKGMLLEKLYLKTREVITRSEFSPEKTRERMARIKEELLSVMGKRHARSDLAHFLSLMPPRYFFAVGNEDVERHFRVHQRGEKEDVVTEFRVLQDRGMTEILIYTVNAPQVFSLVTGVMLCHEINIIGADVFYTGDGRLYLTLLVTDARGVPIADTGQFDRVRRTLQQVLTGQVKVEALLAERRLPDYLLKKPVQKATTRIVIDNDVSAYYTVIDVYAHDRLGLLYDITGTLLQLGCYVEVSKISTKVEQVTDVFYVKDIFGHKITTKEKISAIKTGLMEVIEPQTADHRPLTMGFG